MVSRNLTEQVKAGLAAGAILAVFAGYVLNRIKVKLKDNKDALDYFLKTPVISFGAIKITALSTFAGALLLLAVFSSINFYRYSTFPLVNRYDHYDNLHYYINAKYYDELSSFRLLPAILIANHEEGEYCPGKVNSYLAQDENDYYIKPIRHALRQTKEIKSHFSDERWKSFKHDVIHLQRSYPKGLPCYLWNQLVHDHGFNGTPVWVLIARPIASVIPVEWIKLCTSLDILLLIAMLAAVYWAFGAQTLAFAWLFITISYSFRWPTPTWAFLRYDWLATMAIGICMIKKEKNVLGGAFFAYAALMRYFPALWLFGILAKGLHALITRRDIPLKKFWLRVPKRYYMMALGFFVTIIVLLGISFARDGVEAHKRSLKNMAAHVQPHNLSSMRQGLAIALSYRGETQVKRLPDTKRVFVEKWETYIRVGSIVMMIVLGFFMSRLKDWEVVGLGFIPYFWLTTSSYYYYVMRITAIIIHSKDLSKPRNVAGLVILFGIEIFCNASEHLKPGNRYFLISIMGLSLLFYSFVMIAFLASEWWKAKKLSKKADDILPDIENKTVAEGKAP